MRESYFDRTKDLYNKGYTNSEISEELGITVRTVQRHIKTMGVEANEANTQKLKKVKDEIKRYRPISNWKARIYSLDGTTPRTYRNVYDLIDDGNEIIIKHKDVIMEQYKFGISHITIEGYYIDLKYDLKEYELKINNHLSYQYGLNEKIKKLEGRIRVYEEIQERDRARNSIEGKFIFTRRI